MRLIDADALIAMAKKGWKTFPQDKFVHHTLGMSDIANAPTIDAVPLVRCGNCAKRGKNGKSISGGCPFGMTDDTCDPNAYCSYGVLSMKTGERKYDD